MSRAALQHHSLRIFFLLVTIDILSAISAAQTNTFPSSGNVGIGTTSPGAMLDVAGAINGRNFSFPEIGGNWVWTKVGTFSAPQWGATIRVTAYIHNGFNALNSQDSTYIITFKTSNGGAGDANGFAGNGSYYAVGFNGDIPPGHIKWVANVPGVNASSFDLYIWMPPWSGASHYAVTLTDYAKWTNVMTSASDPGGASSSVLIPNAEFDIPYGNVGIGTTSPGAKLEVNGNLKLTSGSGASITFPDGTVQNTAWSGTLTTYVAHGEADVFIGTNQYGGGDGSAGIVLQNGPGPSAKILAMQSGIAGSSASSLDLFTSDGSALNRVMHLDSSGNVGIGTTNPQYKLSVNGTIQAKEVLVNTGWADYVFQPDYRVRPLAEVAAFIKANRHLPDIPSEAEIKDKGVSLGDMQTKLLAKIEELTLQMIQLDEKNRALEKRVVQIQAARGASSGRNGEK